MLAAGAARMPSAGAGQPQVPSLPPVDWAAPPEEPLTQLERQLVRGSHFTQAAMDKLLARMSRAEAYLTELVRLLRANGALTEADVGAEDAAADAADAAADAAAAPAPATAADDDSGQPSPLPEAEAVPTSKVSWPGVAFRVDPAESEPPVEVDCTARMPICHAVCCKLNFALTPPEVEAGTVKWDLGFPYMIRHESNGYCTHNDTGTGRCGIYADRPGLCRRYSCADDTRIWKDFGAMELNEEWIREHLRNRGAILVRPELPIMEVNGVPTS